MRQLFYPFFSSRAAPKFLKRSQPFSECALYIGAFFLFHICVGLLGEIECPVGDVEEGEDGREDDAGEDVDLLGPRGELVEPGHQKVLTLARLHVDLALGWVGETGKF